MLDRDLLLPVFYLVKANNRDIPAVINTVNNQPYLLQAQAYLLQEAAGVNLEGPAFSWHHDYRRPHSEKLTEIFSRVKRMEDRDITQAISTIEIPDSESLIGKIDFTRRLIEPPTYWTGEIEHIWRDRLAAVHFIIHNFIYELGEIPAKVITERAKELLPETPPFLINTAVMRIMNTKLATVSIT